MQMSPGENKLSTSLENPHFLRYWHDLTDAINLLKNQTRRITEARAREVGRPLSAKLQLHKIIEEIFETRWELKHGKNAEHEVDENLDILFAWLAFNHLEEYSDDEIMWGVSRALNKFAERGWISFK